MPLPTADTPSWLTNLGIILGGAATMVAGWFVARRERAKPDIAAPGQIIAMTGALGDSRAVEKLVDSLERNTAAIRNLEDTTGDNTREIKRSNEALAEARAAVEARTKSAFDEEARLLAAIDKSRAAGRVIRP